MYSMLAWLVVVGWLVVEGCWFGSFVSLSVSAVGVSSLMMRVRVSKNSVDDGSSKS